MTAAPGDVADAVRSVKKLLDERGALSSIRASLARLVQGALNSALQPPSAVTAEESCAIAYGVLEDFLRFHGCWCTLSAVESEIPGWSSRSSQLTSALDGISEKPVLQLLIEEQLGLRKDSTALLRTVTAVAKPEPPEAENVTQHHHLGGGQAARARAFVEAEHRSVKQLEEDKDSRSITLVAKRSSLGELPALGNGTDSGGGFSSSAKLASQLGEASEVSVEEQRGSSRQQQQQGEGTTWLQTVAEADEDDNQSSAGWGEDSFDGLSSSSKGGPTEETGAGGTKPSPLEDGASNRGTSLIRGAFVRDSAPQRGTGGRSLLGDLPALGKETGGGGGAISGTDNKPSPLAGVAGMFAPLEECEGSKAGQKISMDAFMSKAQAQVSSSIEGSSGEEGEERGAGDRGLETAEQGSEGSTHDAELEEQSCSSLHDGAGELHEESAASSLEDLALQLEASSDDSDGHAAWSTVVDGHADAGAGAGTGTGAGIIPGRPTRVALEAISDDSDDGGCIPFAEPKGGAVHTEPAEAAAAAPRSRLSDLPALASPVPAQHVAAAPKLVDSDHDEIDDIDEDIDVEEMSAGSAGSEDSHGW
mmetsp:Transcript_2359/g.7128  ORF Transcript_2359/g.7128 Transcript_2359/m.7128 type:complete len:590 (-) Transcript_2359:383-2152(-)